MARKKIAKKRRRRNPPEGIKPRFRERIPLIGKYFRRTPTSTPFAVTDGFVIIDAKDARVASQVFASLTKALAADIPIYFSPDGTKYYRINIIKTSESSGLESDQLPPWMRG